MALAFAEQIPEQTGFIESMRPNESLGSVLDIDFKSHVEAGRTTLVLDAESTFVEYDGWDVSPEIIEKFEKAREVGIENVVITTNKRPKDELDLWQLQWWIEQIGADLAICPLEKEQRKPSPHMILQVMERFDLTPDQMLMVGDKLTGDIPAANTAGVYSIWVDRLGTPDHIGDRLARRPLERLIARYAFNGQETDEVPIVYELDTPDNIDISPKEPAKAKPIEIPPYIASKAQIVGYGGPIILLGHDKLRLIPTRASDKYVKQIKSSLPTIETKKFNSFIEEHGGLVADVSTYSRLALGGIAMILLAKGHKKSGLAVTLLAQVSDVFDGWASRKSQEDPNSEHRKKMGNREANIDKVAEFMISFGMSIDGYKPWVDTLAQTAREVHRIQQRNHYLEQGFDTRATRSSKNSTLFLSFADIVSIIAGRGKISSSVQRLATLGKISSTIYSPTEWQYKMDRQEKMEQVRDILTQQ